MEITEIYALQCFFQKFREINLISATLTAVFTEYFSNERKFFVFPHVELNTEMKAAESFRANSTTLLHYDSNLVLICYTFLLKTFLKNTHNVETLNEIITHIY